MWSNSYGCKIQRTGSSGSYTYSVVSDHANRPVDYVSWDDCGSMCELAGERSADGGAGADNDRGWLVLPERCDDE